VDNCDENTGTAPLHKACQNGHVDIACVLLLGGAKVGAVSVVENWAALSFAASRKHVVGMEFLVPHVADISAKDSDRANIH
jgi:ankyrin repeat protein